MWDLLKRLVAWLGSLKAPTAEAVAVPKALPAGRQGPYLFVDLYQGDRGPKPNFDRLKEDPRFVGVILKAWQGLHYDDHGFLKNSWQHVKDLGLLRGVYIYLNIREDGARQVSAAWKAIEAAGGWQAGDMRIILDVERAGNDGVTAVQVISCVASAASRVKALTGKDPIFYGRGILEELDIRTAMGCRGAINPSYTAKIHPMPKGWDLLLWQYCGDGRSRLKGYPALAPGLGGVDISCYPWGSDQKAYDKMVKALTE